NRELKKSESTIDFGASLSFPASKRAHLVGIGDATAAWLKEARIAQGRKFESVVLFALDQFCLIGYPLPLAGSSWRSVPLGGVEREAGWAGRRGRRACHTRTRGTVAGRAGCSVSYHGLS